MKRMVTCLFMTLLLCSVLAGCGKADQKVSIGVSMGVGAALRWDQEKIYMEETAARLGVDIEVRINRTDEPKTQKEDCFEMIDSGIDVLILTPRDATKAGEIVEYAKSKNVTVINYARLITGSKVDLFVGYDSERIGQKIGQYLAEAVYEGDYIIIRGDDKDNNAALLYNGAMRYITPIEGQINILADEIAEGWSPEEAAKIVTEAVKANNNKVDAILAPNDKIAGACAEALAQLGVTKQVVITGMDAELDAAKRIVAGTQSSTIYMDLRELAAMAVEEAVHFARKEKVNVNSDVDNKSGDTIDGYLIMGQLVTKENLDKVLIDSGYFTKEEVYGN